MQNSPIISITTILGDTIHYHNIEAVLFDLDGTLIDTLDLHIKSFQWILARLGKKVEKSQLEHLMGRTPHEIISQFFKDIPQKKIWEAAIEKEEYLSQLVQQVKRYDGSIELLKSLKLAGIKSVVISSTYIDLVKLLLEKAELLEVIDDIISGDQVKNGKPDPEPFTLATTKVGISPENCIGIGDSLHDYYSCTGANVNFIGVITGKTNFDGFTNNNHHVVIRGLQEIKVITNSKH